MSQQKLQIGLFGFGVVGEGIYTVLNELPSLGAEVRRICIRDPHKPRNAPAFLFTHDASELLEDPHINLVVELIDDAEAAYGIVTRALRNGKHVVSANKKLLAQHLPELIALQRSHGVSLLYEAAVCGSIPILRNLEEYYDNDLLGGISGIVNGSTNYILTRQASGLGYAEALREAQRLGFAESNPALDVEGWDAANKLCLLLAHAWGIIARPQQLLREGITRLRPADWAYAREKGLRIVLSAAAQRTAAGAVRAHVLPGFVTAEDPLYGVRDEYNGLLLHSLRADRQFLSGKGAGRYPTASAVLSDISALSYQYKYEYKKLRRGASSALAEDFELDVYVGFGPEAAVRERDLSEVYSSFRSDEGAYITGRIGAEALQAARWWRQPGVSVITLPEGSNAELRPVKRQRAEWALAV